MRKLRLILPAALAAAVLFMWGIQFATSAPHPAAAVHPSHHATTTSVGLGAPVKTYFTTGNAGLTLVAATPTALGLPVAVNCPGTTGKCKIEIDNVVQMGNGAAASNEWAVWETMGSQISAPGGPFMGAVPADGSFVTGSEIETISQVVHGNHNIQPMVYADTAAEVFNYMIVIRVYP